jgi:hypothetical protein
MDGLGQKRSAFFCSGKVAPDARLAATDVITKRLEACILGKSAMMSVWFWLEHRFCFIIIPPKLRDLDGRSIVLGNCS